MGAMIACGSSVIKDMSLNESPGQIELLDILAVFLSDLAIIPAVFAFWAQKEWIPVPV